MNLVNVGLVMAKELRETLRDRRTLAVMVLFPLVVYPLVSLLMAQVMASRVARSQAQPSRVAVVGDAEAVAEVRARLGRDSGSVILHADPAAGPAAIEAGAVDAVVQARRGRGAQGVSVRIVFDETRETSSKARERVAQVLEGALPPGCRPVYDVDSHSIAQRAQVGGYVLSKILPLIVVVMVMLGAFYPAIDITAGERERGTLETILSAPIGRFDLMTGKVLAVATLAAVTGILNMASMSLTMLEGVRLAGAHASVTIPWTRAISTLLVVIPTAFLFASVMVAVGSMARSFKEAQTLLTPVYFLCFTPSLIAGLGDYELRGAAAILPGVNVTLLARDLVIGRASVVTVAAVVLSTLAYGALALGLAARLYDSERLLAADEANLRLGPWLRRLLFGGARPMPSSGPNPGQALAIYGVAFVLLFFAFIPLQAWRLGTGLLLTQVGLLALVAIFARGTGQPLAAALNLRRPRAQALVGAALVGLSGWAVVGILAQWIFPAPEELLQKMQRAVVPPDGSRGVVVTVLLMAVAPAICEEALFRGPILRGFARQFSPLAASVLTGALFGLYHLDVYRMIPTAALGVAMSLIALRSGSILPAMLTHFINNASLVILAYLGSPAATASELRGPTKIALFLSACAVLAVGALLVRRAPPLPPDDDDRSGLM